VPESKLLPIHTGSTQLLVQGVAFSVEKIWKAKNDPSSCVDDGKEELGLGSCDNEIRVAGENASKAPNDVKEEDLPLMCDGAPMELDVAIAFE